LPTELADNIAPADIHLLRNLIHATNDMEVIEDTQAPPLPAGPVRGGSSLIAAQAACPFQAFAKHRLHARALEEVSIGPDARQRGLLLHLALEKIWTGLHGHAQLCAQSETARVEIVNKALDAVLEQAVKQRPRTYTPRYTEIEKHVMCNLILTWLDLETQREPFTVQAREQAATLSLSGLELRVVMDRVDETQAGEQVILDYKTGKVSASGWEHERPDAPQLPMYALALRPAPAAVSFAQIRPGEVRLMGCASDSAALPGIKPEATAVWQTRLDEWQKNLIGLAAEYRAGYAAVSPKKRNLSCRYCDLTPLCRIHEVPEYGDQEDKQPTEPFDD
jgi:probable DNA repair protein